MCKPILGLKKFTNNIKVLSELDKTPLKVDIKTRMFKHLQRLPFIEISRYLSKAFKKEELDRKSWIQNSKAAVR